MLDCTFKRATEHKHITSNELASSKRAQEISFKQRFFGSERMSKRSAQAKYHLSDNLPAQTRFSWWT